jgi:hypothetical protein
LKGFQVLGKWICRPDFKIFPTAVSFFAHFTKIMAQSARAAGKGQRKGRNDTIGIAPPPSTSSPFVSVPSTASGAVSTTSNAEKNIVATKHPGQERKYPLWTYVTRKQGPKEKLKGGGNVIWTCVFAIMNLRAPITELTAICWGSLVVLDHVNQ